MSHCEYLKLLSQYMDRQLDADAANSLENHLPHCPLCRKELKELTALRQMCMDLAEQNVPEGLHESVMNRIRSKGSKNRLTWVRYAAIPLAAVLLIFFFRRGISDTLRSKLTGSADNTQSESMTMAASEKESADGTTFAMPQEDGKKAEKSSEESEEYGGTEQRQTEDANTGEPDTAPESQREPVEEPRGNIRASGRGTPAGPDTADMFTAEAAAPEEPNHLRYGILAAAVLALGAILLKIWKPRR